MSTIIKTEPEEIPSIPNVPIEIKNEFDPDDFVHDQNNSSHLYHDEDITENDYDPLNIPENNIRCDTCGLICHSDDFKIHKIIHNGKRKCEFCSQYFDKLWNLVTHIKKIHKGLKNDMCVFCGERFFGPNQLRKHVLQIHDEITLGKYPWGSKDGDSTNPEGNYLKIRLCLLSVINFKKISYSQVNLM